MSIERRTEQHDNVIVVICDDCGEELETGADTIEGAEDEAKNENWSMIGKGKTKMHYCEQCTEEQANDQE